MFFVILIVVVVIIIAVIVLNNMHKKAMLVKEMEKLAKQKKESEEREQAILAKVKQGDVEAQVELGRILLNGGETIEKDTSKAIDWFNKAIAQGSVNAHYCLGLCYQSGEGVEKDLSKAKDHLQIAAAQGHSGAQENLMDAVDYYNRGTRNLKENNFNDAKYDFLRVIRGDLEGTTEDLKMMTSINLGITYYNQAIEQNHDTDHVIRDIASAIVEWEEVLKYDSNPERIAQTKELIEKARQAIG